MPIDHDCQLLADQWLNLVLNFLDGMITFHNPISRIASTKGDHYFDSNLLPEVLPCSINLLGHDLIWVDLEDFIMRIIIWRSG